MDACLLDNTLSVINSPFTRKQAIFKPFTYHIHHDDVEIAPGIVLSEGEGGVS